MQLHSTIIGTGEPLLILHGFLGMGDNWKTHANNLAKNGFQVHLIDQRNHGRSFHTDEFNYDVLVEDVKRYLDYKSIDKCHILGHSMGGKTAMHFATVHPEITHKLIIADISPKNYNAHHQDILKALNEVNFEIHNTRKLVDIKLSEYINDIGIRGFLSKSLFWVEKDRLGFRFNLESLTRNYEKILCKLPDNNSFDGDTLFLSGSKSQYITQQDEPLINKHFKNSEIVTISNAGHWLHAENPKDFFDELITFINS